MSKVQRRNLRAGVVMNGASSEFNVIPNNRDRFCAG
jgi:hypothetical protein